ncbi:MAG: 50S ribosomal protein L6 [Deltaproteobacteria bacterium]|nr:50S ribosomal protein L6 [Deltaproteobacteria bacterium]
MSRVGKKLIPLPSGVEVRVEGAAVRVKGPKGSLERAIHPSMKVELTDEGSVRVVPVHENEPAHNYHGLVRSLLANMIEGVSTGFTKKLLLRGVGYRAAVQGKELNLTLGYSHPILYTIPEGIEISLDKTSKEPLLVVTGIDKEVVGQTAANIRAFRKPEPYHGKGVRYHDEVIVTKVGKSAGKK